MTDEDVVDILKTINQWEPIQVFRTFASNVGALSVDWKEKSELTDSCLYIWPMSFSWNPVLKQTDGPRCPMESRGKYYIADVSTAPVIELSRHSGAGRVYWARDFAAPNGLKYDEKTFSRLVDKIWRWIRKVGKKDTSKYSPYYMPNSWKRHSELQQAPHSVE